MDMNECVHVRKLIWEDGIACQEVESSGPGKVAFTVSAVEEGSFICCTYSTRKHLQSLSPIRQYYNGYTASYNGYIVSYRRGVTSSPSTTTKVKHRCSRPCLWPKSPR